MASPQPQSVEESGRHRPFPSPPSHHAPAGTPPPASRSPSPTNPAETLTLRALVSTKDAGVISGRGGKNVGELRDQTGVKAGVSKVIPGVHERVLTVTGPVDRVAEVSLTSFSSSKQTS
jgi:heterogeneous nuclear rnp K-like protein 2